MARQEELSKDKATFKERRKGHTDQAAEGGRTADREQ